MTPEEKATELMNSLRATLRKFIELEELLRKVSPKERDEDLFEIAVHGPALIEILLDDLHPLIQEKSDD